MQTGGPVLAAVDLSEISPFVVRSARGLSQRLGAALRVVHCSEALTDGADEDSLLPALRHQVEEARKAVEAELGRVLSAAGLEEGRGASWAVLAGDAEGALPEEASKVAARLVVVGAPHPHLIRDTAAHRVARQCAAPVLVVRRSPPDGYRNALVAVDFSEASAAAWSAAASLAGPGAALTAFHVVEDAARVGEARRKLEAWVRERPEGPGGRVAVEAGEPKAGLLRAAAREGADLLAVGRRRHRGLAELFLGALWEKTVAAAPCDVLVTCGPLGEQE